MGLRKDHFTSSLLPMSGHQEMVNSFRKSARTIPSLFLHLFSLIDWLHKGAQPTDTVRRILSYKGVLYLKHLLRGVTLGLFDEAAAMEKFSKWHSEHELQVKKRQEDHRKARPGGRRSSAPPRRVERRQENETQG